jgi:hypothetical protein
MKMRWPFAQWGANAVLCGHEHFYERIEDSAFPNMPYIISGNGGNEKLYGCNTQALKDAPTAKVVKCDDSHWGAMLVTVNKQTAVFKYYTVNDPSNPSDTYIIRK